MTVMKAMMEHAGKTGTENSCKRCSRGGGGELLSPHV